MSLQLNVSNNHPIIPNIQNYLLDKKYISIHSEDRDITQYPDSSEFEILLPQEYLRVISARLYNWSFPANYNVFSVLNHNVSMAFQFVQSDLYNPGEKEISDTLTEGIFAALYDYGDKEIVFNIEPGFYTPEQMMTELTNKMNSAVTSIIQAFFSANSEEFASALSEFSSYDRFQVVYNSVVQKMFFGNTADKFILLNAASSIFNEYISNVRCASRAQVPEYVNWGLPHFLGFSRADIQSQTPEEILASNPANPFIDSSNSTFIPRFFSGDVITNSGDNGYWLVPTLQGADVSFLEAPFKINLMGPAYMYMEIDGWNCIDEMSPFNVSPFTARTNQSNSRVTSSFAKMPITSTPISQWFDSEMSPYKYWNPPAERLSKIKVKLRYHNGALVQFGPFDYSFTLELTTLVPQQDRSMNIVGANNQVQIHGYSAPYR